MATNIDATISVKIDIHSKCIICQEFIDLNEAFAVPPVGTSFIWIACAYISLRWASTKLAPRVEETLPSTRLRMAANIEAKICVEIEIYSKCAICQDFIDLNESFAVPPVGTCCTLAVFVCT